MKTKIILAQSIVIIVLLFLLFDKPKVETKIVTVEKIVEETDTGIDTTPKEVLKKKIKVKSYSKKPIVSKEGVSKLKIVSLEKDTKEYVYIDTFKNGILHANIFSDEIYKRDVRFTTFNKETTTNITKTINKTSFYVAPSISLSGINKVDNVGLNGYLAGGKLILGSGANVDLETKNLNYTFTLGVKF